MGFVDEILEDFVQGVSHMNVAVGEGRAVVQNEEGLACRTLKHAAVKVHILPILEHLRLTLGQLRTHCKCRRGKVQGFAVIFCHDF